MKRKPSRRITSHQLPAAGGGGGGGGGGGSNRWSRVRSKKEESIIHERALAAAILLQQQLQNGGAASFDRSTSLRYPNGSSKKNQALPRSSSSRARSLTDPLLQPHQLVNQAILSIFNFSIFPQFIIF